MHRLIDLEEEAAQTDLISAGEPLHETLYLPTCLDRHTLGTAQLTGIHANRRSIAHNRKYQFYLHLSVCAGRSDSRAYW